MATDEREERRDCEVVRGHEFAMDMHPERYPRESLSRLEEGILEDDELRHSHDALGYTGPDRLERIRDVRNLSRLLSMLGGFLIAFAVVLLLWVGWDIRSGSSFFQAMCGVSVVLGLALIAWGYVERSRVLRMNRAVLPAEQERAERLRRERILRQNERAA
jgi:hypothetical protein